MLEILSLPFGLAAFSAVMLWLAWLVLGEYKKLFLANPKLLMSLEVFAVIAEIGGPGYLAATLAFVGVWALLQAMYIGIILVNAFVFN
jgi:hypothetical protein